jgi:hypothetical protein
MHTILLAASDQDDNGIERARFPPLGDDRQKTRRTDDIHFVRSARVGRSRGEKRDPCKVENDVCRRPVHCFGNVPRASDIGQNPLHRPPFLGAQHPVLWWDAEAGGHHVPPAGEERSLEPLRCEAGTAGDKRPSRHRARL